MFLKNKKNWTITLIPILCVGFFWKVVMHPLEVFLASDVVRYHSFVRFYLARCLEQYHELPLWNTIFFAGAPLADNPQTALFYPIHWLFCLLPAHAFGLEFLLHTLIAGIGMFFFLQHCKLKHIACLAGAVIYMFSGKTMAHMFAGHLPIICSVVWLPWLLWFGDLYIEKRKLIYAVPPGIVLAMIFLTGHVQIFFYYSIVLVAMIILRNLPARKEEWRKTCIQTGILTCTIYVVWFGLSAVQFLPTFAFSNQILRTGGTDFWFASSFSLPFKTLMGFFQPHHITEPVMGGSDNANQFFWEYAVYCGIVPLILALCGAFVSFKKPMVRFLIGCSVFAMFFSFGKFTPFFSFFYYFVPGFNLFRCPSRMMFVFAFAIAALAAFGINAILQASDKKDFAKLKASAYVMSSCAVIIGIILVSKIGLKASFVPLMLGATGLFLVWFKALDLIANDVLLAIAGVCIIGDLSAYGMRMVNTAPPERVFSEKEVVQFLKTDDSYFRILDCHGSTPQHAAVRAGIEKTSGYDPMILGRYWELYNLIWKENISKEDPLVQFAVWEIKDIANFDILGLLNVKYIPSKQLTNDPQNIGITERVHSRPGAPKDVLIYQNKRLLPRAFFVPNAVVLADKEARLTRIQKTDFKKEVILEQPTSGLINEGTFKEATIKQHTPNRITIELENKHPGFLVLSEVWTPGWKALDNGKASEVLIGNHALRCLKLAAGKHKITFTYEPCAYLIGKWITILSIIAFAAFAGVVLWQRKIPSNNAPLEESIA